MVGYMLCSWWFQPSYPVIDFLLANCSVRFEALPWIFTQCHTHLQKWAYEILDYHTTWIHCGKPCFTHFRHPTCWAILNWCRYQHQPSPAFWYLHWISCVYDIHMYIFEPFLKMSFETYLVNCLSVCFFMDFWHFFPYPSIYICAEISISMVSLLMWNWNCPHPYPVNRKRRARNVAVSSDELFVTCVASFRGRSCGTERNTSLLVLNWHKRLKALKIWQHFTVQNQIVIHINHLILPGCIPWLLLSRSTGENLTFFVSHEYSWKFTLDFGTRAWRNAQHGSTMSHMRCLPTIQPLSLPGPGAAFCLVAKCSKPATLSSHQTKFP